MNTTHDGLSVSALTSGRRAQTCGYWFTIQSHHTAHTAFDTVDGLRRYLTERGLKMAEPLNATGEFVQIIGAYRTNGSHYDLAAFDAIDGIRSVTLSNGDYTTCVITTDTDGLRTVHTMNPNAERETTPHAIGRKLTGGNCESGGKVPTFPVFIGDEQWAALWSAMQANYNAKSGEWTETTEHMFHEMLNAVPPRATKRGAFLNGEEWTHDEDGNGIFSAFRELPGNRYAAKYMTLAEFKTV